MAVRRVLSGPVVFIGDIHGHLGSLENVWGKVRLSVGDKVFEKLNVVFLGDYVDRGADSKGVIDFILRSKRTLPNQTHVYLAGNHEFAMQAFLRIGEPFESTDFQTTQERFKPRNPKEAIYSGVGWQKMHIQGRRWGASSLDLNAFDAAATFLSYGAKVGDRLELLKKMPTEHQDFFRNLEWVAELESTLGNIVAVHAGFEEGHVPTQLQRLKEKWAWTPFVEPLCGRGNVEDIPSFYAEPILQQAGPQPTPQYVVSGHHGFVKIAGRRLIIDGTTEGKVSAVLLNALPLPPALQVRSDRLVSSGATTRKYGPIHMELIESS